MCTWTSLYLSGDVPVAIQVIHGKGPLEFLLQFPPWCHAQCAQELPEIYRSISVLVEGSVAGSRERAENFALTSFHGHTISHRGFESQGSRLVSSREEYKGWFLPTGMSIHCFYQIVIREFSDFYSEDTDLFFLNFIYRTLFFDSQIASLICKCCIAGFASE